MTRLRAWLPLVLTVAGFAMFGTLTVRRIFLLGPTWPGVLSATASLMYGGWLLWESRVSARERHHLDVDLDRGTLELAALAKNVLLAACLVPDTQPIVVLSVIGNVLVATGALVRMAAVRRLGAAYSHRIRWPGSPLVTDGPYALVRHPAYLGTLLAHSGLALAYLSVWSIGALLLLWLPAVVVRVVVEDRFLRSVPEYAAYVRRVRSSLIPGLP
jgi:protein-S-isoprenylcysteine O-methyltransferase Ste14